RLFAEHSTLEPDAIFAAAKWAEVCPFEVSLDLAGRAQVVVCDYNYAFDPYVSLPDFGADRDLSDTLLVIDEVHNLVGRGRGDSSPGLGAAAAGGAAEGVARGGQPLHLRLATLSLKLAAVIEEAVDTAMLEGPPPSEWTERAERAVETQLPEDR